MKKQVVNLCIVALTLFFFSCEKETAITHTEVSVPEASAAETSVDYTYDYLVEEFSLDKYPTIQIDDRTINFHEKMSVEAYEELGIILNEAPQTIFDSDFETVFVYDHALSDAEVESYIDSKQAILQEKSWNYPIAYFFAFIKNGNYRSISGRTRRTNGSESKAIAWIPSSHRSAKWTKWNFRNLINRKIAYSYVSVERYDPRHFSNYYQVFGFTPVSSRSSDWNRCTAAGYNPNQWLNATRFNITFGHTNTTCR